MHTSTPCALTAQSPRRTGGSAAWHARGWRGALLLLVGAFSRSNLLTLLSAGCRNLRRSLALPTILLLLGFGLIGFTPFVFAQAVVTTVGAGTSPGATAVNPVTNKIYVANEGSNNVTVVDGRTNAPVTVAVGTRPIAIAVNMATNKIYVANANSNNVTVIDGATNATATVVSGTNPYAIAVNPATNKIYVANHSSNNVTVIDGATHTTATVAAGTNPHAIAVNPATNKIYVANQSSANVTVIDGATNAAVAVAVGLAPRAIAVNPVTNRIYVANEGSDNVTVIDGATHALVAVAAGARPIAITVNAVANKTYVANYNSNNVTVIDGASNTTAAVPTGTNPIAITVSAVTNKIYVANQNSANVTVIDGATSTPATVTAGATPVALAVNPVTNRVYVANQASANVSVIDGATHTTATVVGHSTWAVAINPVTNKIYVPGTSSVLTVIDGANNSFASVHSPFGFGTAAVVNQVTNKIYVASGGGTNVAVVDGASNTINANVTAGTTPIALDVNRVTNKIYVANYDSNDVTVIDGWTNATTTVAAGGNPYAIAVNPVTNKIYVANRDSNTVTIIDGATNATIAVGAGTSPTAIAVNPVTNKIYVVNGGSNNVTVIDGATNTTTNVAAGTVPFVIAVNPVTNRIYVANRFGNNVTVIDGATNSGSTVGVGVEPRSIAVNPSTNKIYVANYGNNSVTVIDGATNSTANVAAPGIPWAIAVNPVTNNVYLVNINLAQVTVITPAIETTLPLTTAISMSGGIAGLYGATADTTPSFTFTPASTYAPTAPPIRTVYYRLSNSNGAWLQASGAGPAFSATMPTLPTGEYVLYAYAVDGLEGGAASGSSANGTGNSPMVGKMAAVSFSVINPLGQTIHFAALANKTLGDAAFTVSAPDGASGNPVTFASLTAAVCTTSGTNGATVTLIHVGTCTIRASLSASTNFLAAADVDQSFSVAQGAQTITFGPAPTINLSASGLATVSATGGASSNPVEFSSLTTSVCTVSGNNGGTVTGIVTGTCVIAANQAGNADYTAAPQVTQNISVVAQPGAPVIGNAVRGNAQVTVNFTPPNNDGNSPITSYIATCGSQSVSGSASPIVVTPLANGVEVTCTVRAVNAIAPGAVSEASNAVTPATVPDAPSIGAATAGNASVSVAFAPPAFSGGTIITSYTATCGAASASGAVSPISVTGLANGVAVTCVVYATNDVGIGGASSTSNSVTPVGPPDAPSAVLATAGNGSISVSFAPSFDNGSTITVYTATCGSASMSGAASPIVVTGVTNGVAITCTVIATNAIGDSVPSAPSNAVVGAGVWRAAGTMAAARAFHTVTLLNDGRVLVAGGSDSVGNYPAAAEIYAPATNSWTTTGSLNTPRYVHTATRLSDGRVLVAGGRNSLGQALSGTEIFDPATSLWTVGPSMTSARATHTATLLGNGRVLLAGGVVSDADLYDPTTNTMSAGGSDSSSRSEASALLLEDGRVLVAGGSQGAFVLASASLYNPVTNTWAVTSSMGVARRSANAVLLSNGSAFFVAGATSTGSSTQTAQAHSYNPFGAWAPAAKVPEPVTIAATLSVVPSGSVLRVGGRDGATFTTMNTTVAYNVSANEWASSSSLISARHLHGAVVLPHGQVLVVGGANNSGMIASAEIRDADGATAPNAPTIGTATPANSSVSVTFTPPENNGGSPIVGYTATCGTQSNTQAASPIVVSDLTNNVAITCTVTATNAFGTGAASAASNSVTPIGVPSAPSMGTATTTVGDVTVNFTAPTNDGGSAITGYTATCGSQSLNGSDSPIVFTNLTPGVAVTCTVRAANSFGLGASSAASNSVTPIGVQTITFGSSPTIGVSNSATLSATGGASGQPVIFTSATPSVCTVSGTNGSTVTGVSMDTCTVNANQAGNASYSAAAQVSVSFTVGQGTQTITFGPAPTISSGQSAMITASGGASGNPIVFETTTPGVCTLVGSTVTAGYAGICTITANQAGSASYQSAPQATLSFVLVSETWTATGSMIAARTLHTLTKLNDGRVLVVGGYNVGYFNTPLASAELYNPSTGTWSATASLSAVRAEHTATLLADGSVLVIGGRDGSQIATNTAERYDPVTNTWSAVAPMQAARAQHTATLLANGKVLVAGGYYEFVGRLNSTAHYDPAINTWTNGPNLPDGLSRHTATLLANGDVLLAGGEDSSGPSCKSMLYYPTTNSTSLTGAFQQCRYGHTTTLLADDRVLLVGGGDIDTNGNVWGSSFAYSSASNTWQARANIASGRQQHTANLLSSGKLLVAGGTNENFEDQTSALVYNAQSDAWTSTANLITGRNSAVSVTLDDGRVLVAGGFGNYIALASAELYSDGTAVPPTIGTATAGDASATVNFTAPSGQGVTSVTAISAPGGVSVTCNMPCSSIVVGGLTNGTVYTFSVTATNFNGTSFASAASNSVTPVAAMQSQTITFGAAPTIAVGGTGTVAASGGASGNPVLFTSMTPTVCTVSGVNGATVTGVSADTCTIVANQAGNANYTAAPEVTQSFSIIAGAQVIAFGAAPAITVGGTGMVFATGGASGNPVLFDSTTTAVCTLSGSNGAMVTGVTTGICTITANQAGNANYAAAAEVTQSFAIGASGQIITFGAAPAIMVGDTGTVSATGGASGNPVLFTSMTATVCTLSGSNGETVTGVSAGTCSIAANQAGNANYAAAAEVVQSFSVAFQQYTVTPSAGMNGAISPSAPILVNRNDTAVFTVTPDSGYFATVAGSCGGSLVGNTYTTAAITADCTVEANFSLGAIVPGAPQLVSATPLNNAARLVFNAPLSNGGSAILDYLASCTPGAHTSTASSSPIDLTGLSNNIAYRCVVRARNVVGSSAASNALSVIPGASGSSADLSISKTNNATFVNDAMPVVYVISVDNPGPAAVVGALVEDALGSDFSSAQWTCAASGGAWCEPNGSDSLDLLVDLPAQASVQITLTTQLTAGMTTAVSNIASITPPVGITDPNLNNNVASDGPDVRGIFRGGFE